MHPGGGGDKSHRRQISRFNWETKLPVRYKLLICREDTDCVYGRTIRVDHVCGSVRSCWNLYPTSCDVARIACQTHPRRLSVQFASDTFWETFTSPDVISVSMADTGAV